MLSLLVPHPSLPSLWLNGDPRSDNLWPRPVDWLRSLMAFFFLFIIQTPSWVRVVGRSITKTLPMSMNMGRKEEMI